MHIARTWRELATPCPGSIVENRINFKLKENACHQKNQRDGKKKRNDRRRRPQRALKRRVEENFPNQKVIIGSTGDGIKMSDVLEEFVKPYGQFAETKEAYRKLLTAAIVAWNVMLFPEKDRSSRLDELLATLPESVRKDGRQIIEELMMRKERFFSQYRRMIIDFEVEDTGGDWHLSVMSTASPA